jgi:hypothetical protein
MWHPPQDPPSQPEGGHPRCDSVLLPGKLQEWDADQQCLPEAQIGTETFVRLDYLRAAIEASNSSKAFKCIEVGRGASEKNLFSENGVFSRR